MLFNLILANVEGTFSGIRARQEGWPTPFSEKDVYYLSKKDPFLGMLRDIRILINKWVGHPPRKMQATSLINEPLPSIQVLLKER